MFSDFMLSTRDNWPRGKAEWVTQGLIRASDRDFTQSKSVGRHGRSGRISSALGANGEAHQRAKLDLYFDHTGRRFDPLVVFSNICPISAYPSNYDPL